MRARFRPFHHSKSRPTSEHPNGCHFPFHPRARARWQNPERCPTAEQHPGVRTEQALGHVPTAMIDGVAVGERPVAGIPS